LFLVADHWVLVDWCATMERCWDDGGQDRVFGLPEDNWDCLKSNGDTAELTPGPSWVGPKAVHFCIRHRTCHSGNMTPGVSHIASQDADESAEMYHWSWDLFQFVLDTRKVQTTPKKPFFIWDMASSVFPGLQT
jgi:hypothetical protein